MQVIKRNGEIAEFDPDKIYQAVLKAAQTVYVLTGGELAAMTMIDATVRLIPEVIGKESSHQDDSFSSGLLEYPQYTRPYDYRGMVVPDVLMSGHHEKIRQWRLYESLKKTYERRPDLLENYQLTAEEEKMLAEIKENKE